MPSPRWPSARAGSFGPRAAGRGEYGCGERTATSYIWPGRRTRMWSGPSPLVRTNGGFPAGARMAASRCGRSRVGSYAGQAGRPAASAVWPLLRMETCLPVGDKTRLCGCGRRSWARPSRMCRILARSPRWPGTLSGGQIIRMHACSSTSGTCIPTASCPPTNGPSATSIRPCMPVLLLFHEWYMHPDGQLPAYEWAFSDVNPPVHAGAAWHIYQQEKERTGKGDTFFLERVFQKLLLNFTWCVNRKDKEENNIFQGGFLGLDNIGVFDRNTTLPDGIVLEQSDGTAWMGMFGASLLAMALELARADPVYEDMATKLFDHFLYIPNAIYGEGQSDLGLWNDEDGFFYDKLSVPGGQQLPLKVRSLVGLIPLLAVEAAETSLVADFLDGRMRWFAENRPYVPHLIARWQVDQKDQGKDYSLLGLVSGPDLEALLKRMLDPQEFLSDYGIRSISKYHEAHPYELNTRYGNFSVNYEPGESTTAAFGGSSNWRGPIWFPINFLLVEALQKYHQFYGDDFLVEYPTGSGTKLTLGQVAEELARRLTNIFLRDEQGRRAVFGANMTFQNDAHWRDYIPFHEYFHGDSGHCVGASHQTGWTAAGAYPGH